MGATRHLAEVVLVGVSKTRKFRTVSVPPPVLEALRTHRQNQIRQQVPGLEKGLIFPSRDGGYRYSYPSSVRKTLDIICTRANLRRITPHWMRHTFNNLLRQAKVDHITMRATTGHSTEAMTEHYVHVAESHMRPIPSVVLEAGRVEQDPDRRIIRMLGARSWHHIGTPGRGETTAVERGLTGDQKNESSTRR